MANILAILPGLSIAEMSAMSPGDLMKWHARAVARSGDGKG